MPGVPPAWTLSRFCAGESAALRPRRPRTFATLARFAEGLQVDPEGRVRI